MQITHPLTVFLPDTRGVEISPYGSGNLKLGLGVFTYSRLPGDPSRVALGGNPLLGNRDDGKPYWAGTCPGATPECQAICYAARPVTEMGPVASMWMRNSIHESVPPIPESCTVIRMHVGGDFDTVAYIEQWIARLTERPDVTAWAYTRSWRVASLLPALERLRALPNVQLFASMDPSCEELPPADWRRAWIYRVYEDNQWPQESRVSPLPIVFHESKVDAKGRPKPVTLLHNHDAIGGETSYVCPEQTGRKADCLSCGYCFEGQKHDVTFLEH